MKIALALALTCAVLTACVDDMVYMQPSRISSCDTIKLGMTFEQVTRILGDQTNRAGLTQGDKSEALETYKWDSGPVINFSDRKVFSVSGCN